MNDYQSALLKLFERSNSGPSFSFGIQDFDESFLPQAFVDLALLQTFLLFLMEQLWIYRKDKGSIQKNYLLSEFSIPFLKTELAAKDFLHSFLISQDSGNLSQLIKTAKMNEHLVIETTLKKSRQFQKEFCQKVLIEMTLLFHSEEKLKVDDKLLNTHHGMSLYRTFDALDRILGLNYLADSNMQVSLRNPERLYEGAGVGVQSGFSSIILALAQITTQSPVKIIDLGSGYGRLGLLVGLMRDNMSFTGYEYVPHRVESANKSASHLSVSDNVTFITQDLSDSEFKIPIADFYYLYDPFSESTYSHVLAQLIEISKHQQITIVTKGNARKWLNKIAEAQHWPPALEIDNGNICLYKSV